MTRDQFDAAFAATPSNTEGLSPPQMAALNALTYELVEDLDAEDRWTYASVQRAFETYAHHHRVVQA